MHRKVLATGLLCAVIAAAFVQPAFAADEKKQAKPDATLDIASDQMRLIFGGTAGKGVLHFNGKNYPFTYKSSSAGVGAKAVKEMSAKGKVYFLKQVEDFAGEYTSIAQSAMAGSAEVAATYKNSKEVTIELRGTVKGVGLSFGGGIATVELVKQ